ncbi:monofunctional biosynthetic peptidoglycan transglycosylase [Cruoricaptor ignavus]|uniref:Biosynthetic peptidoglycan transglycosylase n=1 Tax=Cruoricaptor ignavus TaxID=1118202 RepID=A0A7M1T3U2_9FLAO|nr:monofunctional biosynthetic peptidoglycan transglycosylase [Cruoricaptor ignavus]QOR74421.1 monofunctional biosynthetic peptidoglycan transglycosylase [Cruoricaptor ignavus]
MFRFIRRIIWLLIILNALAVVLGRYFNPPITITQISAFAEYGRLQREYIPLSEMGTNVQKAVLASEDQSFFQHNGFDRREIQAAIEHNRKGGSLRGGSTISQQTAKNVFLWQKRSWIRKGLETFYTFIIEKFWGKEVILERYLNCIEMGRGVFGVEAAAKYYFGKNSKDLDRSEAAWIAAVLPNPRNYDPKNPDGKLAWKHRWILRQMQTVSLK